MATGEPVCGFEPFDHLMIGFLRDQSVPGASLAVAKGDRIVYSRAFGTVDRSTGGPVLPASIFRIASLSKPLTAMTVVRLVERGIMSLDDRCLDRLRTHRRLFDLPAPTDSRFAEVTVRQLLRHTGGWDREQSTDPMFRSVEIAREAGAAPPATVEHIIRYMVGRPLDFAPGQRYAYSNFGYCLLGRILESVTGCDYSDVVRREVLEPLHATRLRLGRTRERSSHETAYHEDTEARGPSVFADQLGTPVPTPYGAWCLEAMDAHGGWLASAEDLVRLSIACFDRDDLISDRARGWITERSEGRAGWNEDGSPKAPYYGLGWMIRTAKDSINVWHTGSLPGTSTLLVRRHDGYHWAVLFNGRNARDGRRLSAVIDPLLHRAADAVTDWPDASRGAAAPGS